MNLSPIFDEEKRYTTAELAEVFECSKQTIRNWAKDDRLPYRETGEGREFVGHELMRAVKQSDFLRKRLRKAHGVKDNDEYTERLEDTIQELQEEKDALEEENERIRQESFEAFNKLLDRMESMDQELQDMKRRLPEPEAEEKQNGSKPGVIGWVRRMLPLAS